MIHTVTCKSTGEISKQSTAYENQLFKHKSHKIIRSSKFADFDCGEQINIAMYVCLLVL